MPADALTVPAAVQRTGERVNLLLPDCAARPSACNEIRLIDLLDGLRRRAADRRPDGPGPVWEVPVANPATLETLNAENPSPACASTP